MSALLCCELDSPDLVSMCTEYSEGILLEVGESPSHRFPPSFILSPPVKATQVDSEVAVMKFPSCSGQYVSRHFMVRKEASGESEASEPLCI